MKRISQVTLLIIVFALLARTGVSTFCPGISKFVAVACASPSDWSEESAEEDGSGEEDKVSAETPFRMVCLPTATITYPYLTSPPPEHDPEIIVPPPQG